MSLHTTQLEVVFHHASFHTVAVCDQHYGTGGVHIFTSLLSNDFSKIKNIDGKSWRLCAYIEACFISSHAAEGIYHNRDSALPRRGPEGSWQASVNSLFPSAQASLNSSMDSLKAELNTALQCEREAEDEVKKLKVSPPPPRFSLRVERFVRLPVIAPPPLTHRNPSETRSTRPT